MFDDADPEPAVYLGHARVPLITLANDKAIKGTFELRKVGQKISLHKQARAETVKNTVFVSCCLCSTNQLKSFRASSLLVDIITLN